MKVLVVLGARPNLIKHFAVGEAFRCLGIDCVSAHTGQHFDANMSGSFFRELGLDAPKYVNPPINATPAGQLADYTTFLERAIYQERPDVTLVYGDVTSTMAGALASSKLGVPVAHVESGVRTDAFYNPEELNRRVAETCAHTLFAHTDDAYQTVLGEGRDGSSVFLVGDVIKDSIALIRERNAIEISDRGYVALSVHRAENTDDRARLTEIFETLIDYSSDIRFPVHPRTRKALAAFGLWAKLKECSHIDLLEPLGYTENIKLLAGASRVLSDSGGGRREGYILGKPVVSLSEFVWVPAMVRSGWEFIAGADGELIAEGLNDFNPTQTRPDIFGDGKAADRMGKILMDRYGGANKEIHTSTGLDNAESLISKSMNTVATRTTVVIPCFNEEDALPSLFERVRQVREAIDRRQYDLDFIFVDDGSRDATGRLLAEAYANDPAVRLWQMETNTGYGAALKQGLALATGDLIATIDADTNYDIRTLPDLLAGCGGGVDVVSASPFMAGGSWHFPFYRFVASLGVTTLYRLVLGKKAADIKTFTCGFRVYRRDIIRQITPEANDFLANAEILTRAVMAGLETREVPATLYDRAQGTSKLRLVGTAIRHLGFLWNLWCVRIKPRHKTPLSVGS